MSQSNPIKLFVSHAWEENDDYLRVFEYLESDSNFYYVNFSTPDKPPAAGDRESLREDLRKQIAPVVERTEWTVDPRAAADRPASEAFLPTEMDFPLTGLWTVSRPGPVLELVELPAKPR